NETIPPDFGPANLLLVIVQVVGHYPWADVGIFTNLYPAGKDRIVAEGDIVVDFYIAGGRNPAVYVAIFTYFRFAAQFYKIHQLGATANSDPFPEVAVVADLDIVTDFNTVFNHVEMANFKIVSYSGTCRK